VGELVGGDPEAVRGGDFAERDVSAAEVFWRRGVKSEYSAPLPSSSQENRNRLTLQLTQGWDISSVCKYESG